MTSDEIILGVHFGHDSTVVLMKNGKVVEAMSEERLSRQKKHVGFPFLSLEYIKKKYAIDYFPVVITVGEIPEHNAFIFTTLEDNKRGRANKKRGKWFLRAVGVAFKPISLLYSVRDFFVTSLVSSKHGDISKFLEKQFPDSKIITLHHHLAHAYATVPFLKDFNKKVILTLDGAGDDLAGSINIFENGKIERKHRVELHDSLGLLYSSFVDFLGMSRNEHEFKVMGLAPYAKKSSGEKVYEELTNIFSFDEEKMTLVSKIPLDKNYGYYGTAHLIAHDFLQHRFDSLAYGIQKLAEETMKSMVKASIKKYGCGDIAVGGGVFMNVKANQYVAALDEVTSFTVAPSCGDESLAIGAAVYGYATMHNHDLSKLSKIQDLYLGSSYTFEEIKEAIDTNTFAKTCTVTYYDPTQEETIEMKVAELLSNNSVVGRFKGRAEWGARALGNRSILANPSSRDNVKLINEMIKGRDFWMPFATSMKSERVDDYLENPKNIYAPFMAITFNTKELAHKEILAALHPYDLTSRPQIVEKETSKEYHNLITHFEKITGIGGILNTSFNLHGEPNVETPFDALRTFELSGLPHLALGDFLISKK
jgi:carbamoyltransferase